MFVIWTPFRQTQALLLVRKEFSCKYSSQGVMIWNKVFVITVIHMKQYKFWKYSEDQCFYFQFLEMIEKATL